MRETHETRLKRLHMRSIRRGIKEMDIVLSDFAVRHLPSLNAVQLDVYEAFLLESDLDLLSWVTGQVAAPAAYDNIMVLLTKDAHGLTRPGNVDPGN